MGASTSKPESSSATHVWKGPSPGVSSSMVDSLQSSSETDTSRHLTTELHIQQRVAEELRKLQSEQSKALQSAREKLSELSPEQQDDRDTPDRRRVAKEVDALRARLEERRQVRKLPDSVESARSEVVRCLRENDRRPLDCWQEVERFKDEVRRLEKGWVDKVIA